MKMILFLDLGEPRDGETHTGVDVARALIDVAQINITTELVHLPGEMGACGNSRVGYAYATFEDDWSGGPEEFPIAQEILKKVDLATPERNKATVRSHVEYLHQDF